jgi:hypothetical protein
VAFSFLQDNGGWNGPGDVSDQTLQSGGFGSVLTNSLENIGVNFAAGAAGIGLSALGSTAGVSPSTVGFNTALLSSRPGSLSPLGVAAGTSLLNSPMVIVGGLLIGGLLLVVLLKR